MIRVIVADDEPKVCQLICGLVDWGALDMEVAGVAHNGIEALEMVETLSPDLIITDIRMPGYDGLELLARAKAARPDLDFIIISGYGHFEYAQSAIKYGVSDYLLKPIKKAELMETLSKMRDKFRRRARQLSNAERMRLTLQNDIGKLRAGLFPALLSGELEGAELGRVNGEYHFHFRPGIFQVFIVKADCAAMENTGLLEDKAAQILRGQFRQCHDAEIHLRGSRVYGVVNCDPEERKTVRRQLRGALEELSLLGGAFGKVRFTAGLGVPVEDLGEIGESLRTAQSNVAQRLVEGVGGVIENVPDQGVFRGEELLADFNKEIGHALEVLDAAVAANAVDGLRVCAVEAAASGEALLRLAEDACGAYFLQLRSHRLGAGDTRPLQEAFMARVDHCCDMESLFACLACTVKESLDAILQDRKQADKRPIRAAKQYIQQNYMNPISLEEVSGAVGFSAAYFSSLFKKESGQNFLEYLSEVRMNKARELLKETNLNVAAICEQVGYNDLKHFTQSFKKATGLKPNEFRKLYA